MAAVRLKLKRYLLPSIVIMAIVTLFTCACSKPVPPPPTPTPTPTPIPPAPITATPSPVPTGPNQPPVIVKIERNEEGKLRTWHTTTITCVAEDPDGDPLTYVWWSTGGKVMGEGNAIGWIAPGIKGDYSLHVKVLDGKGGEVENSITIVVCCCDNC